MLNLDGQSQMYCFSRSCVSIDMPRHEFVAPFHHFGAFSLIPFHISQRLHGTGRTVSTLIIMDPINGKAMDW